MPDGAGPAGSAACARHEPWKLFCAARDAPSGCRASRCRRRAARAAQPRRRGGASAPGPRARPQCTSRLRAGARARVSQAGGRGKSARRALFVVRCAYAFWPERCCARHAAQPPAPRRPASRAAAAQAAAASAARLPATRGGGRAPCVLRAGACEAPALPRRRRRGPQRRARAQGRAARRAAPPRAAARVRTSRATPWGRVCAAPQRSRQPGAAAAAAARRAQPSRGGASTPGTGQRGPRCTWRMRAGAGAHTRRQSSAATEKRALFRLRLSAAARAQPPSLPRDRRAWQRWRTQRGCHARALRPRAAAPRPGRRISPRRAHARGRAPRAGTLRAPPPPRRAACARTHPNVRSRSASGRATTEARTAEGGWCGWQLPPMASIESRHPLSGMCACT
jgi:hypothetical protein